MKGVYKNHIKRILDISICIAVALPLFWLGVLIALLFWLSFNRPIFFIQDRTGRNGKSFQLVKFRTLQTVGTSLEERRFWLGDFLRFTSLDELPQLWNVLKGDMSLIGPRPLPIEYLSLYSPTQKQRHNVRPGITGWAQVNGRHAIPWNEKFELDLFYVKNISFSLDMKIILKTILLMFSFKKDISLQEKKFTGNNHA